MMTDDDRLREPPRDRLSGATQHVDLAHMAAALRAEPHDGTAGHRQIVVVRRGAMSVILFVFEEGGLLPDHRAPGDIIIHVLAGRLEVTLEHDSVELARGQFLSLAPNQPHSVRALERAEMLLTICKVVAPAV